MYFVMMSKDYADEFDCQACCLMTQEYFDQWYKVVAEVFNIVEGDLEIGFGTNEELRFIDHDDFMQSLSITAVSSFDLQALKYLFGENVPFGTGSACLRILYFEDFILNHD